jgi:hydrogenase/urease accessory protein HupE
MDFLYEIITFLHTRKKLWLAPFIFITVVIGGLLLLVQGSVVAPFIYSIF